MFTFTPNYNRQTKNPKLFLIEMKIFSLPTRRDSTFFFPSLFCFILYYLNRLKMLKSNVQLHKQNVYTHDPTRNIQNWAERKRKHPHKYSHGKKRAQKYQIAFFIQNGTKKKRRKRYISIWIYKKHHHRDLLSYGPHTRPLVSFYIYDQHLDDDEMNTQREQKYETRIKFM